MNRQILIDALENSNVQAFLRAIRLGEGTVDEGGYSRVVGGGAFDNFSRHPNIRVYIPRYKVWSSAAGAYQFIFKTWTSLVKQYGFEDFSPSNQDQAAIALIVEKRSLDDIISGNIESAADKCKDVWASLPGATSGQRTVKMAEFLSEYKKHGGEVFFSGVA